MIRAIRLVDTDDISHETVANDLVPRSLPSFSSSVISAAGITVDRTGNGDLTHLKCIVDSPLIALSETAFGNGAAEETFTVTLRISNSTICSARIAADTDSKQMALLLVSNVSVHWIVWRFPLRESDRFLSSFPSGDNTVILPHRSFLFGSLISNASICASSSCLLPGVDTSVFFAIAFDNARVLFIRALALSGTDGPNFEHCFIEPSSLLSRIISLASSSNQSQSVVSVDAFGDFKMGVAAAFILRSSHSLELYNISSKKRLSSCISGPATFTCPGTPLMARTIELGSTRCIGVLYRSPRQLDNSLQITFCKISFLPKLTLSPTSVVDLSTCLPDVSVVDFGLLSSCIILACQTNDGLPLCFFVPSRLDGDSSVVTGSGSNVFYWRRPVTSYRDEEEAFVNEAEQLSHNVLSADCGSVQLLRQFLQALRLPHMGMINSTVISAGISAALSARQALAAEINSSGINESSSRMAVESLSRKIENIWSKDRKVLGMFVCFSKNVAFIYHRHSVVAIVPCIPLLPREPVLNKDYFELLEKVTTAFYSNMLSSSEGAHATLFSSKDSVMECAASFLLALDEDMRYAVESVPHGKFAAIIASLLGPGVSFEGLPKTAGLEFKSLDEVANSKFYCRVLSRFMLTNLDWLLSYTLALIGFTEEGSNSANSLANFAVVVKMIRTILESPLQIEESSLEEKSNATSPLTWVADSFVAYTLTESTVLASYLKSKTITLSATILGTLLTKLLLPQNSSFLLEQFLLDNCLFSEFEALQKSFGSVNNHPCSGYRLYLYGLSSLLRNHATMALEYFTDAAMKLEEKDACLLSERCRSHIARINPPAADFWIRILDLAQQLGCIDIATEAAERAKPYFIGGLSGKADANFARVLDMKLFKLQCHSFNFRGAISTLLAMTEDEDQMAAVNVIVSTATTESKLSDLTDCLLIDMADFTSDKINSLVSTALQRSLRSSEYPDWDVSWSLYRISLSQNSIREAASALFEYFIRLPSLASLTPSDFTRRRDALALAYCTLKMMTPSAEQWIATEALKSRVNDNNDAIDHVITLNNIDELCRVEDARVELINACELPEMDDMDSTVIKRKDLTEESRKPKFEEAAPIILRLCATDLVRWLSTAQLFVAATELCRSLQSPCRDVSGPLIDALCSKLDSFYKLLNEAHLRTCLLRLDDPRPTLHAVHALYVADLELPGWLWRLASKQDSEALLRATIKHKRLLDAGRIAVVILEKALEEETPIGYAAFNCCLPWQHLDCVGSALSEFAKISSASDSVDGASEIVDVHARLQGLCGRYVQHADSIRRQIVR